MLKFIVPYRCRDQPIRIHQLQLFIQTIQRFIPNACIIIVEQEGSDPFNRGCLLNVGAKISAAEDDNILCFHDLNVLPAYDCIYHYVKDIPPNTVRHIRPIHSHQRFGNIILMRYIDFQNINGFPIMFWGCQGEDEELHKRILRHGMRIERAEGTLLNLNRLHRTQPIPRPKINVHIDMPIYGGLANMLEDICECVAFIDTLRHYKVNIKYRIPPDCNQHFHVEKKTVYYDNSSLG